MNYKDEINVASKIAETNVVKIKYHVKGMNKIVKILLILLLIVSIVFVCYAIPNLVYHFLGLQPQLGSEKGYLWSIDDEFESETHITKTINMGTDDYKILVLADIQRKDMATPFRLFGANFILDWISESRLTKFINKQNPDLIVTVGDNTGTFGINDLETQHVADFLDSFEIPWTTLFGNHDPEGRADRSRLTEILQSSKYGIFEYGPADLHGAGNFIINLERNNDLAYSMFLMDSGDYADGGYDGLNAKQADWYKWAHKGITENEGKNVPTMAFAHIPVPEIEEIPEDKFIAGSKGNRTTPQAVNDGFFDAFKENGGTHLFFGHNHINNFYGILEGVTMGYIQKSSINAFHDKNKLGGTLFTVKPDNSIDISIEDFQ